MMEVRTLRVPVQSWSRVRIAGVEEDVFSGLFLNKPYRGASPAE